MDDHPWMSISPSVRTYVRTTARSRPSVSPKAEARGVREGREPPPGTLFHPDIVGHEHEQTSLRSDIASLGGGVI